MSTHSKAGRRAQHIGPCLEVSAGLDRPGYGFIVRAAQGSRSKIRCTIGSKAERGMVS